MKGIPKLKFKELFNKARKMSILGCPKIESKYWEKFEKQFLRRYAKCLF